MAKIDEMNEIKEKWQSPVENIKSGLFEFLFRPASEALISKAGNYMILGVAYLGGVFHWAWLINYGRVDVKYMDWDMFFNCYKVIQKALSESAIPYFTRYFFKGTDQFLAFPSSDLFPTIFLLKFLSVEEFFLFQMIFAYSLGFVGCLWLKKTYQWSLFTFVFFFFIFSFNGHVVSHISMGHWPWISYFMLSFFAVWVFKLVDGDISLLHGTRLAWVFFAMLLFGGLHTFVWCLIFLLLLCLCQKRFWKPIMIGVGLSLVFSFHRLLPAAITYMGYSNEFVSGFPSISVFWKALTYVKGQENMLTLGFGPNGTAPWWEVDHYIGIIGLGVMAYFGIFLRLTKKCEWGISDYRALNIPMLILTIFTFGSLFKLFTLIPIPFISVERVSSRFLIVPLLILLVVSCIWMQQMFNRISASWRVMLVALAGISVHGFLFIEHSSIWQVKVWGDTFSDKIIPMFDTVSSWAKSVEWLYVPVVQISYLVSLIAIAVFVAGSVYFSRRRPSLEKVGKILRRK
jgi:hypothetical protein